MSLKIIDKNVYNKQAIEIEEFLRLIKPKNKLINHNNIKNNNINNHNN